MIERMRVAEVLEGWRPDRHNLTGDRVVDLSWDWPRAVEVLYSEDAEKQLRIEALVLEQGLGFADDDELVTLWADGVVADGHHRLAAAQRLGLLDELITVDRR